MEELTLVLYIAALVCFALSYKITDRSISVFTLVLSICGLSAVFQDSSITDELTYLAAFPLVAVTLFAVTNLCILKEGKS